MQGKRQYERAHVDRWTPASQLASMCANPMCSNFALNSAKTQNTQPLKYTDSQYLSMHTLIAHNSVYYRDALVRRQKQRRDGIVSQRTLAIKRRVYVEEYYMQLILT